MIRVRRRLACRQLSYRTKAIKPLRKKKRPVEPIEQVEVEAIVQAPQDFYLSRPINVGKSEKRIYLLQLKVDNKYVVRGSSKINLLGCVGGLYINGLEVNDRHPVYTSGTEGYGLVGLSPQSWTIDRVKQNNNTQTSSSRGKLEKLLKAQIQNPANTIEQLSVGEAGLVLESCNHVWLLVASQGECSIQVQVSGQEFMSKQLQQVFRLISQTQKKQALILGTKNVGKSSACGYLINKALQEQQPLCFMDLDVGKSSFLAGTVSLYYFGPGGAPVRYTYWIGEYSPLNYCELYLQSIAQLRQTYLSLYFSVPLVVNTMGYMTGLGELLIYEIFNCLQPHIIVLMTKKEQPEIAAKNILTSLQSKSYLTRTHFQTQHTEIRLNQSFMTIHNPQAVTKNIVEVKSRGFEQILGVTSIKSLLSLSRKQKQQITPTQLLLQNKQGIIIELPKSGINIDLQLLIICEPRTYSSLGSSASSTLLLFKGIGFGLEDKVYVTPTSLQDSSNKYLVCLKSEGVQFERQFFNLSQKQLVSLQLELDRQIKYLMPTYKALGSVSYRNLSAKSQYKN